MTIIFDVQSTMKVISSEMQVIDSHMSIIFIILQVGD